MQRKEHISTPKIDKQMEAVLTPWRRQKEGESHDTERK